MFSAVEKPINNDVGTPDATGSTKKYRTINGLTIRKWLLDLELTPTERFVYSYFLTHSHPIIVTEVNHFDGTFDQSDFCFHSLRAIADLTVFSKSTLSTTVKSLLEKGLIVGYEDANKVTKYRAVQQGDKPVYFSPSLFSQELGLKPADFDVFINLVGFLGNKLDAQLVHIQNFAQGLTTGLKTVRASIKRLAAKQMLSAETVRANRSNGQRNIGTKLKLIPPAEWKLVSFECDRASAQTTPEPEQVQQPEVKPVETLPKEEPETVPEPTVTVDEKLEHLLAILATFYTHNLRVYESGWNAIVPASRSTLSKFMDFVLKGRKKSPDYKGVPEATLLFDLVNELSAAALEREDTEAVRAAVEVHLVSFFRQNLNNQDVYFPVKCRAVQIVLKTEFKTVEERIEFLTQRGDYTLDDIAQFKAYQ